MEFQRLYKPGGTFMITLGDATGRMRDRYVDKWGRWVSQSFIGRAGRIVTIVSAYQVVTDTPVTGGITAASQQYSLLMQTQDSVIHPRRAFRRDLKRYLIGCKNAGHELLVMGDFNEDIGQEADGMIAVMQSLGLIDIMRQQHALHLPVTYARGQKRLDYVLGTAAVATAVQKAGYEPFNARYTTDHRPYFVDFSVTALFGHPTQPLSKMEPRLLKSNNLHQVTAYVRRKYDLLEQHNVFRRIDWLLLPGNRHSFAERLDKDVVEASPAAEKSIRKYGEPQWSVELRTERKKVQILKKCLSMAKTRLDNTQSIRQQWRELYGNTLPPGNERECIQHLRQAELRVKELVNASFEQREHERLRQIQELEKSHKASDKSRAKTLRQLHVAEVKNKLYAKIRAMRGLRRELAFPELKSHYILTKIQGVLSGNKLMFQLKSLNISGPEIKNILAKLRGLPSQVHP
ncbi:hypothetical protein MHU86_24705 [Fragilaria crotonensis]|nr:hypothetical protein MHU86_24705 [Fragilaria crotonensis]